MWVVVRDCPFPFSDRDHPLQLNILVNLIEPSRKLMLARRSLFSRLLNLQSLQRNHKINEFFDTKRFYIVTNASIKHDPPNNSDSILFANFESYSQHENLDIRGIDLVVVVRV